MMPRVPVVTQAYRFRVRCGGAALCARTEFDGPRRGLPGAIYGDHPYYVDGIVYFFARCRLAYRRRAEAELERHDAGASVIATTPRIV